MDPNELINARLQETTAALRLAANAIRSPFPGESLRAIQPQLRTVASRNDAFLKTYDRPPYNLNQESAAVLREVQHDLVFAASTPPEQWQSLAERLAGAKEDLKEVLGGTAAFVIIALVLVLLLARK